MLLHIRPEVQLHKATKGNWYFCVLSAAATRRLLAFRAERKPKRHTPAEITIGKTTWATNIIPDKTRGWLFVIKADVRRTETIEPGKRIAATVRLLAGKGNSGC